MAVGKILLAESDLIVKNSYFQLQTIVIKGFRIQWSCTIPISIIIIVTVRKQNSYLYIWVAYFNFAGDDAQ